MEKVKKIMTYVTLTLVMVFSLPALLTLACELNFSVSAVIPENQIDKSKTYFDLRMQPNEEQTLYVKLRNDTSQDVEINMSVNTAITNNNGIIDYGKPDAEKDETLKIDLADLVEYEKKVKIPKNKTIKHPIKIKMPEEEFSGMLLGGIHFKEEDKENESENQVQIENKFAYVLGLTVTQNDDVVKPDMELLDIKAEQVNYRNAVKVNLQNPTSIIIEPLAIEAKIYKENGDKVLFDSETEGMRMAPHSNFDYAIMWGNQPFKSGKYRLEMRAKSEEDEWKWTEVFTIDAGEAKELNEQAVELEKNYFWYYFIGGLIALILLLIIVYRLGQKTRVSEDGGRK